MTYDQIKLMTPDEISEVVSGFPVTEIERLLLSGWTNAMDMIDEGILEKDDVEQIKTAMLAELVNEYGY